MSGSCSSWAGMLRGCSIDGTESAQFDCVNQCARCSALVSHAAACGRRYKTVVACPGNTMKGMKRAAPAPSSVKSASVPHTKARRLS